MLSSRARFFWRTSPMTGSTPSASLSLIWSTEAIERSFTRTSDASAAVSSGLPIARSSSPSLWSTMCRTLSAYSFSTMASRSFRGPTIKARVIGTGLSIQGPFEPLNQAIDRAFEIRRGLRLHRVCRVAARGEDGLRLAGRDRFRLPEDLRVPGLGLTSQRLAELECLAPRIPQDSVPLDQDGLFRTPDLTLGGLDFLESFLLSHAGTSGDN